MAQIKRIVLHTKDVMIITGKSERYSRDLIKKMKEHYLKKRHQYITIKEFSDYLGLDNNEVEKVLF
ncbi:MAG: hypothetical protein JJT77_05645 [Crocinitomicaceae bacterium]|nr:hypothetical protein [Crocinitomicaceae bacterium]